MLDFNGNELFFFCGLMMLVVTGKVGDLTMALSDLVWEDMVAGPETHRLKVPYV